MNRGGGGGGAGGGGCGGGVVVGGGGTQWWRPVSRVPCLGFYSRNVNTLRPTLGSFCFWSGERLHLALDSIHRM